MVHDPVKAQEETPRVDLVIATEMLRARRNGALALAFVLAVLIGWRGWNPLLLLLPAVAYLGTVYWIEDREEAGCATGTRERTRRKTQAKSACVTDRAGVQ